MPIQTPVAGTYTPAQYTPTLGTATTTSDQLVGILNKGGALMQSAATTGNQSAAQRGLLNSSMGVQAAQQAMIDKAAPIAESNASQINSMTGQNMQAQNTASQWNANQTSVGNQWNVAQQNDALLKSLDINSREQLANIEAQYKTQMQTSASADTLYSQVMKNINEIQLSPDVADKETAINSQLAWLRSGMQMISNLNGVTGLVTF